MKKVLLVLVAFGLVLGVVGSSFAHFPEGVTYLAYQFPAGKEPKIDAGINDWSVVGPAYTINTEDIYEQLAGMGKNGSGVNLADLTIMCKLGWSPGKNSMYWAVRTFDNIHMVTRPSGDPTLMWQQDAIEVMTDADHTGGQFAGFSGLSDEENKRQVGAQGQQHAFAFPNADGVNQVAFLAATWYHQAGSPFVEFVGAYQGAELGEGTTTYEVRIGPMFDDLNWAGPDQSKAHVMKENEILGIGTAFADFDDPANPGQYHAYWNISGTDATFMQAERLGDVLMSPLESGGEPGTSVEPATWGRIKASFN